MVGSDYEGEGELPTPTPKPVLLKFSTAQKLAEIKREIVARRRIFGAMVEVGAMKAAEAEFRIRVMEEIACDYGGSRPPQRDLRAPA